MSAPAVRLVDIDKSFGAVKALQGVSMTVPAGAIHGLVGENGAGKTTLMRILYGAAVPDSGTIEIEGKPLRFRSSAEAADAGVGMVSQHYGIVPGLTCLENLVLGAEGGGLLRRREMEGRAEELAQSMGFRFTWSADADTLSPSSAQKLEILKLLWRKSRIMILDEPTAMLSPADSAAVFESLLELVARGSTVLLVTHRLPEVMHYCSTVTVLRGGKRVAEMPVSSTTSAELAHLIVGAPVPLDVTERSSALSDAPVVCSLRSITVRDSRGHSILRDASLTVREGELVGVAGVDGNGQRELLQAILGTLSPTAGGVEVLGEGGRAPSDRLLAGLRIIPEDRHAEGIVDEWSLEENASLGLHRMAPIANGGAVDLRQRHALAKRIVDRFKTKHGGLALPMASLSGGNQQRFVAARALELNPRLLVAFQPARGLDLGATADVYRGIREKCAAGMGALVISYDLDELLENCDRIVVAAGGSLVELAPEFARDREQIGRVMVGAA